MTGKPKYSEDKKPEVKKGRKKRKGPNADLVEVAVKAKEAGLSYGHYVLKLYLQGQVSIEEKLKMGRIMNRRKKGTMP